MTTSVDDLTTVILNWRTPDLTVRAARALIGDGVQPARLVVVDNGSGDGSPEVIAGELPGCVLVELEATAGFGEANNRGALAVDGAAFLFVNSDAFVHRPGSVVSLLGALADHASGIVVPRLLNEDLTLQPSVVPLSSPLSELVRASGLSRFVPNRWQPELGTHWDHSESRTIQSAVGAVLLLRGETWRALGGFDERRFMYAEDHDLFWRARELGWRAGFVADAEFVHLGGGSTRRRWSDPQRAERVARAEAAMIRDHRTSASATTTLALMAAGVGTRALYHRLAGNRNAAAEQRAWLRGYRSGF